MAGVFISYRRSDTSGYAGRLFGSLAGHFGVSRVFMDIDAIDPGRDYVEVIRTQLASCDVMIALIGRNWLTIAGTDGRPRLDDPRDLVRLEMETALQRRIPIIPTLVGGASLPAEDALPEPLRPLSRRQALEIDDERYQYDVSRLVRAVSSYVQPVAESTWLRHPAVLWAIGVCLVTACLVLFLFIVRVRKTDVALDVTTSDLSFSIARPQLLSSGMALASLGVSGLSRVTIPDGRSVPASGIRLHAKSGSLSLANVGVPEGTRVWIKHLDVPNHYRLSLKGKGLDLRVDVVGVVEIALPGTLGKRQVFDVPRGFQLIPDSSGSEPEFVDLDFGVEANSEQELCRSIQIRDLSFAKIENTMNPQNSPREISSILRGAVSAARPPRTLASGDWIRLASAHGEIRSLGLLKDRLAVEFRGYASGLSTGSHDSPEDLMPTWFEWLRARHSNVLAAGTLLSLVAFAAALRVGFAHFETLKSSG